MENKNDQNIEESKEINNKEDGQKDQEELSVEDRLKEAENKNLRSLAEIENQRRRYEKEIKEAFEFGGFNFAKETLSLLDNLNRAQESIKNDESLKDSKDLKKFLENIKIIEKDIISVFEKNNIKKISCLKKKFDPNLHQAMLEIEDETNEPGTIVQEIQPGYMYGERLLRPSFVGISKKKGHKNEKK
tara:strand:- start:965 stop:1528 length:564 start_codon:yes stop_codon:yes gene_type:complete